MTQTEYLTAADQVFDLARTLILTPDAIPMVQVDALLDQRVGLVIRATSNVAATAYLGIASHLGLNLNDHKQIEGVLNPVEPGEQFTLIPAVDVLIEDPLKALIRTVWDYAKTTKLTTDDAVAPLYIESAVSPAAVVINGAMPLTVKLVRKLNELNNEAADVGIERLRRSHRKYLRL